MALKDGKEYKEIAKKLIDKYPIAFGHIEIDQVTFLIEDEKAPKKYADCRLVRWPMNYYTDYKYMIIFYENVILNMTQAQKHMLVYHEILHIAPDFQKLRKHDVEDFMELVSLYGATWAIDPNLVDVLEDEAIAPTPVANPIIQDDYEEPDM